MTQPAPAPGHALAEQATEGSGGGESVGTVLLAGAVNLVIAIAKAIGGMIGHSAAMLSESAHSVADTVTEIFLFIALKRGDRPPDQRHPFGYGRETYFWAFLASLTTFVVGAGFSVWQGVTTILHGEEAGPPLVSYLVLAVSFVLEGASWLKAVRQVRGAARHRGLSFHHYLQQTTDTPVKAVTFEDSAALVGLVLAAVGVALEQLTGDPLWDGLAAIAIGVLLVGVAVELARVNVSLLIGQAAPPALERALRAELVALEHVAGVPFLITTVIGPGELVVAAKVDFDDTSTVADVERVADEAERRLVARFEGVRYVFLDPTPGDARARMEAHRPDAG
jgi:cation diffusion facilitator family transporter